MGTPWPYNSGMPGVEHSGAQRTRRVMDAKLLNHTGVTQKNLNDATRGMQGMSVGNYTVNGITQGMQGMSVGNYTVGSITDGMRGMNVGRGGNKKYKQKRVNKSRRVSNRRRRNKSIRRRKN